MFSDKKGMAICISAIFFVVLDRLLKYLAVNDFFSPPVRIVGDVFKLDFSANYNIAFSLPLGGAYLNIIISIVCILLLALFVSSLKKGKIEIASFLFVVIVGAGSNLLDRFKFGYVVDYFDLTYFTVFNLADVMIALSVVGLTRLLLCGNIKSCR